METLNDKIESLNKFFKFVKERDQKLILNFIYKKLDK